jgi:hypothetical protein
MPITINGSGTVTGITAGGLPDAIITQSELATNVAGNGPAFSAYAGTSTSMSSGVYTKIVFNTERFDTNTKYDTSLSRFQPDVAGYYQINSAVELTSGTGQILAGIFVNGNAYKLGTDTPSATFSVCVSGLVYLNGSTDYVEIYVYQNQGTSRNASATASGTYFDGSLIRAA